MYKDVPPEWWFGVTTFPYNTLPYTIPFIASMTMHSLRMYNVLLLMLLSSQEGASNQKISVFTTKADTLFGVSFLALSPEHELLQRRELFTESVLKAVDEMRNNPSINSSSVDANNRPKNGTYRLHNFG
jgi:hypothetical protein